MINEERLNYAPHSHKEVWALEIATVDPVTCKVAFREEGYAPVKLPADMWSRYKPISVDFYVQWL